MGLGILDVKGHHVPGTNTIFEDDSAHQDPSIGTSSSLRLKYDTTGKSPILLVPQPSDDPADPLNWPLWRRDLIMVTLSALAIIATTLSPIMASDSLDLTYYFRIDFTGVAMLTGYHLLGVCIGGILFVPSARIWGKRHCYLLGTIIVCISSAWAGASGGHYRSMLWARIIQGVGLAPFEALLQASVGDLYFVHERGKRMALSTLAVFGSAFLTPVIVGVVANKIGWKWSFYMVAIISGALLPVCFFFCPETAFIRSMEFNNDMVTDEKHAAAAHVTTRSIHAESNAQTSSSDSSPQPPESTIGSHPSATKDIETAGHVQSHVPNAPPSYLTTLLPVNGRKSNESFFKLFFRPFPLFFQPGILWACLIQGTLIGWTVFIGITLVAILLLPPLFFNDIKAGFMYAAAFIGALVGFVLAGLLSDSSAKWLTKRNNGVYEPEFRIWLVLPQLLFGGIGLFGFGWTADDPFKYGWHGPAVFFGFVTAGMVFGAVASSLYIVDAHREIAVEAFTCLIIFKNIFSFALTFKGYDWLVSNGTKNIFVAIGCVQVGICCLAIPMYVFGKYNRYFFSKYDIFRILHL